MRTTKVVAITMPPAMARDAARLAKKQNRTLSELMREAFRRYQQEDVVSSSRALHELAAAVAALRTGAKRNGLDKRTPREVDSEVSAYRREKRAAKKTKPRAR